MKRTLLVVLSTLLTLAFVEGVFRVADIDARLLRRGLYFQNADLEVHQCSTDPFLHYELKPASRLQGAGRDGGHTAVNIDTTGARFPAHAVQKDTGTFRILCFGGSTMYGAGVSDEETIPAALEARLNGMARAVPDEPRRYEVWNFGTSGYTLGQAAHLARSKLAKLAPDLIVVQLHNVGRRPYLSPAACDHIEIPRLQDGGAPFFDEQFPAPELIGADLHQTLLRHSAIYRSLIPQTISVADGSPCEYCNRLSESEARRLVEEANARGIPVVFVAIPADSRTTAASVFRGLPASRFIHLYRPGREADFYEIHPPARILDEFAGMLVDELRSRGLLARTSGGRDGDATNQP